MGKPSPWLKIRLANGESLKFMGFVAYNSTFVSSYSKFMKYVTTITTQTTHSLYKINPKTLYNYILQLTLYLFLIIYLKTPYKLILLLFCTH